MNATSRRYAIEDWKTPVEEAFIRAAALRCLVFSDYVENSSANIQSVAYAAHLISNISMAYCIVRNRTRIVSNHRRIEI